MGTTRVVRDLKEAQYLWETLMPREVVTDLWAVRACFQSHFRRPIHFIVEETGGQATGLLPLSWIEETGSYSFFPGETWDGRTWLEQNHIPGNNPARLIKEIPGPFQLRYLSPRCGAGLGKLITVDETGYLFLPDRFGYDMEKYFQAFSGKSRKQILSGIRRIRDRGLTWRYDSFEDLDLMIAMNISRFGNRSYFHDRRFRRGFTWMLRYFEDREWLKVTTALVDGEVAAVDAGVLFNGSYTLMAGGTNPSFPGIAKVINMRHMERACEEGFGEVDFLCGDFNWKKMFHLHERPLYLAADRSVQAA